MQCTLNMLLDALASFDPKLHQTVSTDDGIERVCMLWEASDMQDEACLYVATKEMVDNFEGTLPTKLVFIGLLTESMPFDGMRVLISIEGDGTDDRTAERICHLLMHTILSFERWEHALLMHILHRQNIVAILKTASEKLTNPIAMFDNNLTFITKAGRFDGPITGTIWERIESEQSALLDFYTQREQQEIARHTSNDRHPTVFYTINDETHTYVTAQIKIGDQSFGALGLVDINQPFTAGQLDIIQVIADKLKLYFRNNEATALAFENETALFVKLLDGAEADADLVSYHLKAYAWKAGDNFQLMAIRGDFPFDTPMRALPYIKHIKQLFSKGVVLQYAEAILVVCRYEDYETRNPETVAQIEATLKKLQMNGGVSTVFSQLSDLKYYHTQCHFAMSQCIENTDRHLLRYDACQQTHIIQMLKMQDHLKSFCHAKIFEIWEKGDERDRELIHSLYHYLIHGRNLALSAKALFLHRNTLAYRIQKIAKMLNVDLNTLSENEVNFLMLSCMIVENGID
ncbi:MAG: hypothetical protein PWP51_1424 [Clostridiales bacterium]|nr:hypothetical protein [Clostridiales bacterium]MDN5298871.1 hypothetical protein [Clostridiales bacterium]